MKKDPSIWEMDSNSYFSIGIKLIQVRDLARSKGQHEIYEEIDKIYNEFIDKVH